MRKNKIHFGFTLVELLVVMAILGVLVTLVGASFQSAQVRGRDAQRKSDLKEIVNSLEIFLSDYHQYPAEISGQIAACPFTPGVGGAACVWGSSEMTDTKTVYFKVLPKDPSKNFSYLYRIVPGSNNQKFQLFAYLENPKDPDCLSDDCANPGVAYSCGTKVCNFAITSSNTTATE